MNLLQDLRFAVRLLIKDRGFTFVAVLALALGIGVNATVFTFVNAVLIRGLPFDEPDRILSIGIRDGRDRDRGLSYPDFQDWRDSTHTLSSLAVFNGATMNVSDEGQTPERYGGPYISANGFGLIGQRPLLGRDFLPEDDAPGAAAVVMLGHGIWSNRYGADPAVIGRTIKINGTPATVIGVMPEGFKFPLDADLWQPLAQMPNLLQQKRDAHTLQGFGRLAPGATLEQARAELANIAGRLAQDFPDTNKDIRPSVMTFNERYNGGQIKLVFLSLMGAVGFVLLIACANVANLLLGRSAARAREMSVRVSLGATRWRIVRQLLAESLLLSALGGLFGLALAAVGIRLFALATADVGKPYWIQFTMDARVLAFFAAVCLGTGVIFGLAPALHASKADLNEVLKDGGRGSSGGARARRWTSALIVVELALTLVLLAGAGFMMRSFVALYRLDLGIETTHLLTMSLSLPNQKYDTPEQRQAFFTRLDERLGGVAGLQSVTIATAIPMSGGGTRQLRIEGRPEAAGVQPPIVTLLVIGPRYFDTLGARLARGRGFDAVDGSPGHQTAIVNQRFVAVHFGNEDPIGRTVTLMPDSPGTLTVATVSATIVGISPTIRQRFDTEADADPVVYLPLRAQPPLYASLIVRGQQDVANLTTSLREEVRRLDADLPLFDIHTMNEQLARQRWSFRIFGTMFGIFAVIALALSAVGLYAVTAYSVAQRTQEIGVRMALGAQASQVWWLILRRSFAQLAIGLGIGLAGALGVGKLLQSLLVQTGTRDPITLGSIAALLVVVSVAACVLPARRATRLDPIAALRYE
ncbi:MAG TPA: ABC transporter permease [Vicinamibacterales bacterium]